MKAGLASIALLLAATNAAAQSASPAACTGLAALELLHRGAVQACDADDGVMDGVISDPPRCEFDPGVLACDADDARSECLAPEQVAAARAIYSTPVDERTGEPLYPPFVPGGERNWAPLTSGPDPYPYATVFYRFLVFDDPDWNPREASVNFGSHVDLGDRHAVIDADEPDISAFLRCGGNLLMIGGWTNNLPPGGNVEYYENVVETVGPELARDGVRLFMVPGMHHCLGEEFPLNPTTDFDAKALLRDWKGGGSAPERIVVTQTSAAGEVRERLVCAWPRVARYVGDGDPRDASSYACEAR